ncbi:MAG: EAL domain-containing protein [Lachnospiraceae bacterium]|nr:EAL domain-containing protein [Lachnospiraceae bacterium]
MDNVTNRGGTYRMDGACFSIISTIQSEEELIDLYEEIRAHFRRGIKLDDMDIMLELNAGLISLDDFDVDDQTIYSCLNFAYEESKVKKHGDIVIFRDDLTDDNRKGIERLHAIRASITRDFKGFYLLYQPVVDAESEKLIGVEALLRWRSEEYGVVPPDFFIPFLETDPLFPTLGEWILDTALRDAKKLTEYVPDLAIHINLSYAQMEKPDFADVVRNAIRKTGLLPEQVCLEITERCRLLDMDLLRHA